MRVLSYSEVLMRLNPPLYERLEQAHSLDFSFTGTGMNFLAGLNLHQIKTEILTVLPDNRIGDVAASRLLMHGVGTSFLSQKGSHIGSYLIELGYGVRPSQVTYLDRAHSSFNTSELTDASIEASIEACDVLHICGIALSTSEVSMTNALRLVELAANQNKRIIFDFNFRPSLNESVSLDTLLGAYEKILVHAHTVFGSKRDIQRFMACETDEDIHSFMERFNINIFAGSEKALQGSTQTLQGKLYIDGQTYSSKVYEIATLDRIGTGDAFASALVGALIQNEEPQYAVEYASVASQLSFTTIGDVPLLSPSFIKDHMNDPKDVIR